jgi:hypothetical protein
MPIEKGTIKVVWITKSTKRIYSKMFDDIESANQFGKKKKDYIIFRLLWHKKFKTFAWTLLPYGNYNLYQSALRFYQKYNGRKMIIERWLRL